jgi:hypothetical protein
MDFKNIADIRLASQQIVATKCKTAKEVVAWMGAMQAQDYNMAKWAIGLRLPASMDEIIQETINSGEVLRTHILRPTWHFVAAEDIYWMLGLTAPQMKTLQRSRHKELGLTEKILAKSNSIIAKALSGGKHLSREELMALLEKSRIDTGNQKSYHLMHVAELNGVVCSGKINEKKQTYALLEERVQKPKSLTREEALARLAQKYFTSHCPATLQDFTWWSGLSAIDARHALEMVKIILYLKPLVHKLIGSLIHFLFRKPIKHPCIYCLHMMNLSSATKIEVQCFPRNIIIKPFPTMVYSAR